MVRMRGIIGSPLSTPFHKYDHVCCVAFRFWLGATREHPPSRPVGMTEEQQRQNRKATQPCGRRFFSAQTSLLTPRMGRKSIALDVVVFMKLCTKRFIR